MTDVPVTPTYRATAGPLAGRRLGQPGDPPAGPRPRRRGPHQRRPAGHQGRGGAVGYASVVPLAATSGATASAHYDARQALDELHATGVRVIGRIVCFLDPVLSKWAWESGGDMIVLDGAAPPRSA